MDLLTLTRSKEGVRELLEFAVDADTRQLLVSKGFTPAERDLDEVVKSGLLFVGKEFDISFDWDPRERDVYVFIETKTDDPTDWRSPFAEVQRLAATLETNPWRRLKLASRWAWFFFRYFLGSAKYRASLEGFETTSESILEEIEEQRRRLKFLLSRPTKKVLKATYKIHARG